MFGQARTSPSSVTGYRAASLRVLSIIFTTNKALKAWGRVLHDEDLGQAIIDRVLEHGRLMRLDGPSIRTLHLKLDDALKEESDQEDEVARISGTHTRPA